MAEIMWAKKKKSSKTRFKIPFIPSTPLTWDVAGVERLPMDGLHVSRGSNRRGGMMHRAASIVSGSGSSGGGGGVRMTGIEVCSIDADAGVNAGGAEADAGQRLVPRESHVAERSDVSAAVGKVNVVVQLDLGK